MEKIQLGNKVRCIYTGFKGTVIAKTEYINGCVQFSIVPKVSKKEKYPDDIEIDERSLELVHKRSVKIIKKRLGGAVRTGIKMRGH